MNEDVIQVLFSKTMQRKLEDWLAADGLELVRLPLLSDAGGILTYFIGYVDKHRNIET